MTVSAAGLQQALGQLTDLRKAPVTLEAALERVVASANAPREAFERLRRLARDRRRPLSEVARSVVSVAERR